jgi:hypothetical protein
MLGVVLSAVWSILSADDFAIPRWAFHALQSASA